MTTQQHTQQLNFLQEKIQEIGSAIFFNLSDSVLKLPTSIVKTLKVDDYGFVWFVMQKPRQNIKEFEAEFPVQLDYFKKGIRSFLQVCGKGWVVTDPEEMNTVALQPDEVEKVARNQSVLVKVKILKAEFFENKTSGRSGWWQNLAQSFATWFRHNNNYRPNTYYPAS
jgi:hypothetical protein